MSKRLCDQEGCENHLQVRTVGTTCSRCSRRRKPGENRGVPPGTIPWNAGTRSARIDHPLWGRFVAMHGRCSDLDHPNYGGRPDRPISVCPQWSYDAEGFAVYCADVEALPNCPADVRRRPGVRSLDRRDNDGDYCPENMRWATPTEQRRNQRRRYFVGELREAVGELISDADWPTVLARLPLTLRAG